MPPDVTPRLTVAFVITGLGTGGAETMLLKLLERSPTLRGGRVIALGPEAETAARIRALGVQVDCLGLSAAAPDPRVVLRLLRLLEVTAPDVISTWLYHADLIGGLAGRWLGIPVVWGVRNSHLSPGRTPVTTTAVVKACAWLSRGLPAAIACCSNRGVDVHVALGYPRDRFRLVPNGFDLARFRPDPAARAWLRAELGLAPDAPVVGMVARFDPLKNHRGLVAAARRVVAARPDARFVLVGKGAEAGNVELAGWLAEAGLAAAFRLMGQREDMPRITAGFDIAVLTSSAEGFPNALGEAMACGVPCVATDVGDAAEILGPAGRIVPVGDMDAVAGELLGLLSLAPAARAALGDALRERVGERFDIDGVVRRFEQLYAEVAAGTWVMSAGADA